MATRVFHRVWHASLADLVQALPRRIRRLTSRSEHGWDYSLRAVLRNQKNLDSRMEIDRWERLWRITKVQGCEGLETQFRFLNKSVLELGCGPVLGIGPIALFLGAEKFYFIEPSIQRMVTGSNELKERYFRPLYSELVANYGARFEFASWYAEVMEKCVPIQPGVCGVCDIVVSNSVLEHIPRLAMRNLLAELNVTTKGGGVGMHLVDFGPHGFNDGTLKSLYRRDWASEPAGINLLRKSDIETELRDAGFELLASLTYKTDEIERGHVHGSWHVYSDVDLCTRVAIFLVRKTEAIANADNN